VRDVGAGGVTWAVCAEGAGDMGAAFEVAMGEGAGADSTGGLGSAGGTVLASIIVHLDEVGAVRRLYIGGMEVLIQKSTSHYCIQG